jgi:hypothetical protein
MTALSVVLLAAPARAAGVTDGGTTEIQKTNTVAPTAEAPAAESSKGSSYVAGAKSFVKSNAQSDEVIVEVYLRRHERLSAGIVAHVQGEDMLLPLQEVMILLQFAVSETPNGASGWFIAENREFDLDTKAGIVLSDGVRFTIKAGDIRVVERQLYVSARALSQWLPLNFQADLRGLTLSISPREQTPMDARALRANGKNYGSIYQYRSELPKVQTPYALAQIPGIEVDLFSGYSSNQRQATSGTARMFGDFLFMNGEVFLTGTDRGLVDARTRFGRVDPDGGLLGSLNATSWHIGDVGASSVPLVSFGLSGRGAQISSRPGSYIAEFDRITVEDSIPLNHEAELYRNGILIASSGPSTTGRYRFESVPLLRGANEIRVEIYGPQGQRKTEIKQYVVGDQQIPVGKLYYDATAQEAGRSVFGFTHVLRDNRAANSLYDHTAIGGTARFDYGLTRNVSVSAGLVAAPLPLQVKEAFGDSYRYYSTLGARTMIGNFGVVLDSAFDNKGGIAAGAGVTTVVKSWNISARHERFMHNFGSDASIGVSAATQSFAYRTSATTVRAETFLSSVMPGVHVNLGVLGGATTYSNIDPSWRAGGTVGLTAGRFSLSNDLYYGGAFNSNNQGIFGTTRANLRLFDNINLRASVDYDLRHLTEVSGVTFGGTAPLPYDNTLGIGYTRRFDRLRDRDFNETYFASLRRKFGTAEVGLLASFNRYDQTDFFQSQLRNDYRAGVTVSFSTFTDPRTLATIMSGDRIARQGAIRPKAFYDENQNGIMDAHERTLSETSVVYAGQREPFHTGRGRELTEPVGTGSWVDVVVDRAGLDGGLTPGRGVAVLPRPGVVSNVDLPVMATAGVEGRVDMRLGKNKRSLPNVKIQIVRRIDGYETVIAETNTEFDGVFSLATVPIGDYIVRVEPEQAKQIGARAGVERAIRLTPETKVLDGVALEFVRS